MELGWVSHQLTPSDSVTDGDGLGVFVVHAAMLPTGKVLWFSGHAELVHYLTDAIEWDPLKLINPGDPESLPDRLNEIVKHKTPDDIDIFCCHLTHLPDGRILIVGGSTPFRYFGPSKRPNNLGEIVEHNGNLDRSKGIRDILVFDPSKHPSAIEKVGELIEARWYPTLVNMPDGNVLVFSGWTHEERNTKIGVGSLVAETVELIEVNKIDVRKPYYTPKIVNILTPDPQNTAGAVNNRFLPIYPGMQLAANGRVYSLGPTWRHEWHARDGVSVREDDPNPDLSLFLQKPTSSFEVDTEKLVGKWIVHVPTATFHEEGTCINLHPITDGRILVLGGSSMRGAHSAIKNGVHLDPSDVVLAKRAKIFNTLINQFESIPNLEMQFSRINVNAVLLPDETVLIISGHDDYKWNKNGHLECEIYNPHYVGDSRHKIDPMGSNTAPSNFKPIRVDTEMLTNGRTYHSAALLLTNGTVIVGGGVSPDNNETLPNGSTTVLNQKTCEIYRPDYFDDLNRPTIVTIAGVPISNSTIPAFNYDDDLVIEMGSGEAEDVTSVILMKLGAMTHHTDTEQRSVLATSLSWSGNFVHCKIPVDPKILPPGHYMVFARIGRIPCVEAGIIKINQKVTSAYDLTSLVLPQTQQIDLGTEVQQTFTHNSRTITLKSLQGFYVQLLIDNIDVKLTYYPETKTWGAKGFVLGTFPNVAGLAEYLINNKNV